MRPPGPLIFSRAEAAFLADEQQLAAVADKQQGGPFAGYPVVPLDGGKGGGRSMLVRHGRSRLTIRWFSRSFTHSIQGFPE